MKTVQEQIEVMQHFANGGEVEFSSDNNNWHSLEEPQWNWSDYDYRIKEQKKTVTIEKWLLSCQENGSHYHLIVETSNIGNFIYDWSDSYKKIKLLDTYEVEI